MEWGGGVVYIISCNYLSNCFLKVFCKKKKYEKGLTLTYQVKSSANFCLSNYSLLLQGNSGFFLIPKKHIESMTAMKTGKINNKNKEM
jgi:hypothetical protein